MNCFRVVIFFFLFTMPTIPADAIEITYTLYNEANGLNRTRINDIQRGTLGYYWMATERGLIRFDGKNFLEINPKEKGFSSQEVRKLYRYNNLLYIIYQDSGCFSMDLLTYHFRKVHGSGISDLVQLDENRVVFLMKDGTFIKDNNKAKDVESRYNTTTDGPLTVYKGNLIVSLPDDGVYIIDQNTLIRTQKLDLPANGNFVRNTVSDKLFYLSTGSLYELDSDLISTKRNLSNVSYFSFLSPSHQYYIQNSKQLVEINNEISQNIPLVGLVNFELRNLIIQDANTILVGTNQGLILVRKIDRSITNIDDNNIGDDLDELRIRRKVLEYRNDQLILFGSPFSYLYTKDHPLRKFIESRMPVYDAVNVGNYIYAATEGNGLQKIDIKTREVKGITVNPLSPDGVYSTLYYDSVNSNLFIGAENFLIVYHLSTDKTESVQLPVSNTTVRALVKDTFNEGYWIGTSEGLFYMDSALKAIHTPVGESSITKDRINDLLIRRNTNELWVAHDLGVDIIDLETKRIVRSLPGNTFVNPNTVSILEDQEGLIWMGTYAGIIGYNPQNGEFLRLSKINGLMNSEFKHKAALKLSSGKLIFGGLSGYDIIDPTIYDFINVEDRGLIAGYHRFTATDTTFVMVRDTTLQISFDTEKEFLHIYLSSTNFINAANHTYEYNIDGGEWIRIGGPYYINVLRLNPGDYQINIRAFDESGALLKFYPLMITATIPFYKSWVFLLGLIFITLSFFLLFIITVYKARSREERLKEQISMDLHDEVGTILTRAQHLIRHDLSKTGKYQLNNYISESLFSLRVFINTMNKKQFTLLDMEDELNEMIHNINEAENCVIKVETTGQGEYKLKGELFRDIKLCLYEIINNALKHSNAKLLTISLSTSNQRLNIHTRDNGFLKDVSLIENKGNGVKNIRKRVERNQGQIIFSTPEGGTGLEINIEYPL